MPDVRGPCRALVTAESEIISDHNKPAGSPSTIGPAFRGPFSHWRNPAIFVRPEAAQEGLGRGELDHDNPLRIPPARKRRHLAPSNEIAATMSLNDGPNLLDVRGI